MECSLKKGELTRLTGGEHGMVLHCLSGTVWLTIGDGRDYLVRQGTSFDLRQGVSALAEALGPAWMRMETLTCEAAGIAPISLHREVAV